MGGQGREPVEQLLVGVTLAPGVDDALRSFIEVWFDNRLEGPVMADPHVGWIEDSLGLQLERDPVVDIVADVFFVGQDLVDRASGPRSTEIGHMPFAVQYPGDFAFGSLLNDEHAVEAPHDLDFFRRARLEDHAVGLKALLLASFKCRFRIAVLIDQHAAQAEACWTSLPETKPDEAALTGKDLRRQFPAVFSSHGPLHALDNRRTQAAVVFELLRAVVHLDPAFAADELIVGAFVGILKTAPSADIIDEDHLEVGVTRADVRDQLLK